jgi:hypothetical protein
MQLMIGQLIDRVNFTVFSALHDDEADAEGKTA